jgi:hypothetical protein
VALAVAADGLENAPLSSFTRDITCFQITKNGHRSRLKRGQKIEKKKM